MNAIGYAHFELNGGLRKVVRWSAGFALLSIAAVASWARYSGGGVASVAQWAQGPLMGAIAVFLILVANLRIAAAVKLDATLNMSRSHRLMPQSPASAVAGYIVGPALAAMSAAGAAFLVGFGMVIFAGGDPLAWMASCALVSIFALLTWCVTVAGGLATTGGKARGSGWVAWVFIGPMFGRGMGILGLLPGVAVVLGPLIGESAFSLRRPDQITWALGASCLVQLALAALLFGAACRRYARDDRPGISAPAWVGLFAVMVTATLLGIWRFDAFQPTFIRSMDGATPAMAVPAFLTVLLLLCAGPIQAAEQEAAAYRYRRAAGDELADEFKPSLTAGGFCVLLVAMSAALMVFGPPATHEWQGIPLGGEAAEPTWTSAWSITMASFACGVALLWAQVRVLGRLKMRGGYVWIALTLWAIPLVAAGGLSIWRRGDLDELLSPLAAFSSPGAIWTAWHVADPLQWVGVGYQALLAVVAGAVALRVPDRIGTPIERPEHAPGDGGGLPAGRMAVTL